MAIAHIQAAGGVGTVAGTTMTTAAFTAVGTGNSIVGIAQSLASGGLVSVTDNAAGVTNTYQVLDNTTQFDTYGTWNSFWIGINIRGNPTVLTFHYNVSTSPAGDWCFDEYSNVGSLNASTYAYGAAAPNPSISITSTLPNCMIWSFLQDSGPTSPTAGSGFTLRVNNLGTNFTEDQLQGAAGAITAAWVEPDNNDFTIAAVALAPIQPIPKGKKRKPLKLVSPRHRRHPVAATLPVQIPRRPRKKPVQVPRKRPSHRARSAPFIGAATFLNPPSKSWVWNHQAALLNLTLGTVSKAWNWNGQAAKLNLTLGTVSKAWNWATNAIAGLPFTLGVVSKAWNWVPHPATLVSTNIKVIRWNIMRPVLWGILRGEEERPKKGP